MSSGFTRGCLLPDVEILGVIHLLLDDRDAYGFTEMFLCSASAVWRVEDNVDTIGGVLEVPHEPSANSLKMRPRPAHKAHLSVSTTKRSQVGLA